jgi:hypothetical protein
MERYPNPPHAVELTAEDRSPAAVRRRLHEAVRRARRARLAVLTVRHPATGSGRRAAEKALRDLRARGLVGGTIEGVDFSMDSYSTRGAVFLHPELEDHPELERQDPGVTLVFLGTRLPGRPRRRFRFDGAGAPQDAR